MKLYYSNFPFSRDPTLDDLKQPEEDSSHHLPAIDPKKN